ncbi:ImmA/IrrE family metallo-endopeptidase [Metabacillus sp. 22489]|uniref:ImmA/IrrE family metallo-endopeptidase n=1 Tax=Metabacillus sp. 22489 TaxID=3453928 RepID=UPI003F87F61B
MMQNIRVAGMDYCVNEVEGLIDNFELMGQIRYNQGIIEVDNSLCKTRKEQVFTHELLHAIFKEAGYDEQDEEMIERVSLVLYQVIKDNPNLLNRRNIK